MKERIRKLRNSLGLTQTEFGEKIGLTRAAVSSYEAGTANPTGTALRCMELVFGANPQWLADGTGEPFIRNEENELQVTIESMSSRPSVCALLSIWARMDEETQQLFERVIEDYFEEWQQLRAEQRMAEIRDALPGYELDDDDDDVDDASHPVAN